MEQNCVKMYGAKAKGLLVKEISKVNGIVSQKIEFIDQKHKKWRPNEKLSIKCKHFSGGGVIYVHFYKWDRSLDFVLVVYDLIELIIEVSY